MRVVLLGVATTGLLLLGACSYKMETNGPATGGESTAIEAPPDPPPSLDPEPRGEEDEDGVVRVFFATDRRATADTLPAGRFGGERSQGGALHYGTCEVSIPRDHRMGELEAPSIWRLEFREDPEKHVVLLAVETAPKETFFAALSARVRDSGRRKAFLFVHGYNVTFEDAARRTAQISYDLGFDGAPVFYSWPSKGAIGAYTVDEANVEWSQTNLKNFLADFLERSDAEEIYLIAHSMGNRAATRAFAALMAERPDARSRFKEVILAAPDIDADVFKRDIAPAMAASGRPITLYASSEDVALAASKRVHGSPRAGDSGSGLVVVPGIETIDASGMDTSFLQHSYFAEATSVLSDIFQLVHTGMRAQERPRLQPVEAAAGRHWAFQATP